MNKVLKVLLATALFMGVFVGMSNDEASAHATSSLASTACNAYVPMGIPSNAVVLHAHEIVPIIGLGRNFNCERWNFQSGSASHGGTYKVLWLNSCNCPFGPFDVVSY
jgi:hypothetical protein